MKFVEITLLFSILGLSACSPSPGFSWLKVQPQPLLKVTFPDGQEDIAVLKRYNPIPAGPDEREEDIDKCIFNGYLSEEKDVYVTVTGCPLSGKFDVLMRSSRHSHSMFSVAEGVVRQVPSTLGSSVPNRENVMTQITDEVIEVKQQPHQNISKDAVNPNGYAIRMKIKYDENFAKKFGSDARNTIRRVTAHAENIWNWPSLPASLTFHVDRIEQIPGKYVAATDLAKVGALSTDPKFNSFVYWAYRNDQPGIQGMGYVGAVCSPNVGERTSLIEYMKDDLTAARIFAHELGHNMGMSHDFLRGDPRNKRTDSKGQACTGIGGVMDYSDTFNQWSTCSVEDMTNYIKVCNPFCLTAF